MQIDILGGTATLQASRGRVISHGLAAVARIEHGKVTCFKACSASAGIASGYDGKNNGPSRTDDPERLAPIGSESNIVLFRKSHCMGLD